MPRKFGPSRILNTSASAAGSVAGAIWCPGCRTDAYILIEQAGRHKRRGEVMWDVDYTCTNCDNFYGHDIEPEALSKAMVYALISVIQRP